MSVTDYADYNTPAEHARQISITGAPLLNLHNQAVSNIATVMTPGAVVTLGPFSVNQPGYLFRVSNYLSGAGAAAATTVKFQWTDSGSGLIIGSKTYTAWPGAAAGGHVWTGYGRARGNQVTIIITNNSGTAQITLDFGMWLTSVPFTEDRAWSRGLFSTASGFTIPQVSLDAGVIGANAYTAVAASGSKQDQLGLYQGRVLLHAGTQSGLSDLQIKITDDSSIPLSGAAQVVWSDNSNANGQVNAEVKLPGDQCSITITNQNAAAKNLNYAVTALDL